MMGWAWMMLCRRFNYLLCFRHLYFMATFLRRTLVLLARYVREKNIPEYKCATQPQPNSIPVVGQKNCFLKKAGK